MKNSVPYLYVPEREAEFIKNDFKMQEIIDLLNKHKEILKLTANGDTAIEVSKKVFKNYKTIENYIYSMKKAQLIAIAIRLKIIE